MGTEDEESPENGEGQEEGSSTPEEEESSEEEAESEEDEESAAEESESEEQEESSAEESESEEEEESSAEESESEDSESDESDDDIALVGRTSSGLDHANTLVVDDETRFTVILENDQGLRIPEAEYEIRFADGSTQRRRLGRDGTDVILNPPLGPLEVTYLDLDDIKAKSLAASARRACEQRNAGEIFRVLGQSPELVQKAAAMYGQYFNDFSGKGMVEDFYAEITEETPRMIMTAMMARAELPTRESVRWVSWEAQVRAQRDSELG